MILQKSCGNNNPLLDTQKQQEQISPAAGLDRLPKQEEDKLKKNDDDRPEPKVRLENRELEGLQPNHEQNANLQEMSADFKNIDVETNLEAPLLADRQQEVVPSVINSETLSKQEEDTKKNSNDDKPEDKNSGAKSNQNTDLELNSGPNVNVALGDRELGDPIPVLKAPESDDDNDERDLLLKKQSSQDSDSDDDCNEEDDRQDKLVHQQKEDPKKNDNDAKPTYSNQNNQTSAAASNNNGDDKQEKSQPSPAPKASKSDADKKDDDKDKRAHCNQNSQNNQRGSGTDRQSIHDAHAERIAHRSQALTQSKEQLRTNSLAQHTYEMSPQARGFMQANNIDYTVFNGASVTNFQHCLTQEILGIVEASAGMAQNSGARSIIGQLATYNCNLAVSAQQLNQASHLDQAVAVTDLSHFFNAYGQLLVDSGLQSQAIVDLGLGVGEGTARALQQWYEFGKELYSDPGKTVDRLADDYITMGQCLCKIACQINEASPIHYYNDLVKDSQDIFNAVQHGASVINQQNSRVSQRSERNAQAVQDGLSGALQAAQQIVAVR